MRKTFSVEKLKTSINNQILHSPDADVEVRQALFSTLESILHDTGNYAGFQYLDRADMKFSQHGNTVGINTIKGQVTDSDELYNARFDNTDRTRVRYF